jgi:hypothetical protein
MSLRPPHLKPNVPELSASASVVLAGLPRSLAPSKPMQVISFPEVPLNMSNEGERKKKKGEPSFTTL